jgi:hypothetical protein
LGTIVGAGSDDDVGGLSIRFTLDVGVPVSDDENDDDCGVLIRTPGEYEREPGIDKLGGGCLYTWMSLCKLS